MLLAYIDPTTTSTLLYVVIGVAASVGYACRGFFYKIKDLLLSSKTGGGRTDDELVFYSEGRQYWPVFEPVLKALDEMGVGYLYVSSGQDDPGLRHKGNKVHTRYVSPNLTPPYLNHLKAKVVVMTTPQLDVLTIRRSKHVKHYVHLVHAPTDFTTYRKFAFDHFDSVMCAGPHQIKSARYLENLRGYPPKLLLETGCTYYDGLVETLAKRKAAAKPEPKDRPVVLVAPTWKPYGFLNRFGRQMVESLLSADKWDIIFRPHPQTAVSFPEVLEDIRKTFDGRAHFTLDVAPNGAASMDRADMMISELSGIVFDYAFTQGKPTLIFNGSPDLRGFEAEDFDCEMWEVAVRSQIGVEFGVEDIPNICSLVERTLQRTSGDLAAFRDANIYNFGKAGPVAADQICEILKGMEA